MDTLLSIVQDILNDMDSDAVSTVGETQESIQVANICRSVFKSLDDEYHFPTSKGLFKLDPNVPDKPNYMRIPDEVKHIEWLKYDTNIDSGGPKRYTEITYLEPRKFLDMQNELLSTDSNVKVISDPDAGVDICIRNDRMPTYWTSFDDEHICFDSYDSNVEAELQQSKTQCYGEKSLTFEISDKYRPDIPEHLQSLFVTECKSMCFAVMKQMTIGKVDEMSKRQRWHLQANKFRSDGAPKLPDYGRKPRR